jgi:Uri superfamily endonuclease
MIPQLESNSNATDALLRPGCYSLIIDLKRKKTIRVGKIGEAVFLAGTYVYTGSAMKGLGARLRRHCARKKKTHWHIDHLLTLPDARIKKLFSIPPRPVRSVAKTKRLPHGQAQWLSCATLGHPIASQAV